MGYFSEMALNKQEELGLPAEQVPAGDAFEDEETFDELPVPSASRSAVTVAIRQAGSMARAFPAWNRRSCSALALCSGYAPIR